MYISTRKFLATAIGQISLLSQLTSYQIIHKCIPTKVSFNIFKAINVHHTFNSFYRATAMLSAVYAVVVWLSVCVCVSVTLRYCIKMAKRRITQTTPHDSPMTLVF